MKIRLGGVRVCEVRLRDYLSDDKRTIYLRDLAIPPLKVSRLEGST